MWRFHRTGRRSRALSLRESCRPDTAEGSEVVGERHTLAPGELNELVADLRYTFHEEFVRHLDLPEHFACTGGHLTQAGLAVTTDAFEDNVAKKQQPLCKGVGVVQTDGENLGGKPLERSAPAPAKVSVSVKADMNVAKRIMRAR